MLNILVVDDSPVMRKMIIKTVSMSDIGEFSFIEASNGKEALDILEKKWVDLILADINMPVMSGEEMIDKIRANPVYNDIPVLVVSTEKSEDTIRYLEKKTSGFVHKPFTPELIGEKIKELTGGLNVR
ncbi:MAG: response regulator [Elusimicrobiales bacterium]